MRRAVALRITILLLSGGGLAQGDIARRLDLAKASASHHLNMMAAAGVVAARQDGRRRIYSIVDETYVRGMLANFTPIAEDLDPFTGIWNDLFG